MKSIKFCIKDSVEWRQWEDQLEIEKEFCKGAILILKNNELIGQAIIYFNPHHLIRGEKSISIGNIKVPNDPKLLNKIHDLSKDIAISLKAKHIISPMNGSTWNDYRFVSYQPNLPFLLETTSEQYLLEAFKNLGYQVLANYFSSYSNEIVVNEEKYQNRYESYVENGMRFDNFNISAPKKEFAELAKFCNKAFRKNALFSPIKEEDFIEKMMKILPFLNPSYTIIARKDDEIAGFIFAYQDFHSKDVKTIVVKTLARDIDKPYKGLGAILSSLSMKAAQADGFKKCIHALMIDHNTSTYISNNYKGEILSKYELLYYSL